MNKMMKLKSRLFGVIGCLVLIAVCVSVAFNLHVIKNQENAERQSRRNTLQIYMQFVEDTMTDIENMLEIETQVDGDLKRILRSSDQLEQYLALVRKKEDFKKEIKKYRFLDGIFLFDSRTDMYVGEKGPYVTADHHMAVKQHIPLLIHEFQKEKNKKEWMAVKLDEEYYLIRILSVKELYFATWIKPEHLLEDMQSPAGKEGEYIFLCDKEGNILNKAEGVGIETIIRQMEKDSKIYDSSTFPSEINQYSMKMVWKERSLIEKGAALSAQIFIILFLGIFLLLSVWGLTREIFLEPLDHMLLKKELEKNRARLQFMQLQMNPHFLNNCLSLIRNLVMFHQNDEAEKAVLLLSRYTRGSLQTDTFVEIKEELRHIQSYYELQKMRLDKEVYLETFLNEGIEKEKIPAMLLYTFVENAIKHQQYDAEEVFVTLEIKYIMFPSDQKRDGGKKEEEYLWIQIADNGAGFSPDIIELLDKGEPIVDKNGRKHIGVCNVVSRLNILYGQKAHIHFANGEYGGAEVTVILPVEKGETDDEK